MIRPLGAYKRIKRRLMEFAWQLKTESGNNAEPGKFVLITGVGHCGTKWLAHVLRQPKYGIVFYHEHKFAVLRPEDIDLYCATSMRMGSVRFLSLTLSLCGQSCADIK